MRNITYINAGAGSGKTHSLTQRLADLIEQGKAKPEQVILTTFTSKAATEFKEKAKAFLFQRGLFNEALRLDQALVGTVHSVANSLINKFWFKLGLPPNMGVMGDNDVEFYISQSLSDLATEKEQMALNNFVREFEINHGFNSSKKGLNYDLWKDHLKKVIELATNYQVDDFIRCKDESLNYIAQFRKKGCVINHTTSKLKELLCEHQDTLDGYKPSGANDERKATLRELSNSAYNPTVGWYKKLGALLDKTTKKNGPHAQSMQEELADLWHSELVYKKQEEYISLLFSLADRWQTRFAEFKKEKRILDYNDMEKYLLELTQIPSACEEIKQSFRFLFVDEFQDCSPIQVKIFLKLSELMEHSYWVGDYKQSIYGFRGSDINLVKAVVDNVDKQSKVNPESGCSTETLKQSWRSLPDIVDLCNATFRQTFQGLIPTENITLEQVRQNTGNVQSLRYIMAEEEKDSKENLAAQIAWMVKHEGIAPADIAVISRTNAPLETLANELQGEKYRLPVSRSYLPVSESNAALLLKALLQIVVSDSNTLAKATVAWLTRKGFNTPTLIDDKLRWDNTEGNNSWEYLNNDPLVAQLLAKRDGFRRQGLSDMVQTIVIELGLYDVAKQWPDAFYSSSAFEVLISTAQTYEEHCRQMGLPATIYGYLDYVDQANPTGKGDSKGIQLLTYHASKGLQWKHVILLSLNDRLCEDHKMVKDNIYGVQAMLQEQPSAKNPFPQVYIRLLPFIYGSGNSNVPADIETQIMETEEYESARNNTIQECNRLLYVGMTRARDILTLAIENKKKGGSLFHWLEDVGLCTNADAVGEPMADLLGLGIPFANATASSSDIETIEPYLAEDAEFAYKKLKRTSAEGETFAPQGIAPSKVAGTSIVLSSATIGERIPVKNVAGLDYAEVGNCIHQIFCGIENATDPMAYAQKIIDAYGFTNTLEDANAIVDAWKALIKHLKENYGPAEQIYHERPFRWLSEEHIYTGSVDLVWQTAKGTVVVDFKSNPMPTVQILDPNNDHFAGLYGGQLSCYQHALQAAGNDVLAKLVFYPVSSLIVELGDCAE